MMKYNIIPINYEFQRMIYSHLNKLSKMHKYAPDERLELKIRDYKSILRSMKSYIQYTINYKGIQRSIATNDLFPKRKNFEILKHLCIKELSVYRILNKKPREYRRSFLDSHYYMTGGTHTTKGSILELKKVLYRRQLSETKFPKTTDNYIGLEIECFGKLKREQLEEKIIENKMHKWAKTVHDGSIRPTGDRPYPIELNFMFKETDLDNRLTSISQILKDFDAQTNDSCGLHVHLDARHRDVSTMFHNLVTFQDLFFKLNPGRMHNTYCQPVQVKDIGNSDFNNHYAAISSSAYRKYKTIEIRIHAGTVDIQRIEMWLKLLIRIANYPHKIELTNAELKDIPNLSNDEMNFFGRAL